MLYGTGSSLIEMVLDTSKIDVLVHGPVKPRVLENIARRMSCDIRLGARCSLGIAGG